MATGTLRTITDYRGGYADPRNVITITGFDTSDVTRGTYTITGVSFRANPMSTQAYILAGILPPSIGQVDARAMLTTLINRFNDVSVIKTITPQSYTGLPVMDIASPLSPTFSGSSNIFSLNANPDPTTSASINVIGNSILVNQSSRYSFTLNVGIRVSTFIDVYEDQGWTVVSGFSGQPWYQKRIV